MYRYLMFFVFLQSTAFGQNFNLSDIPGIYGSLLTTSEKLVLLNDNNFYYENSNDTFYNQSFTYSIGKWEVINDSILLTDRPQIDNDFVQQFCSRKTDISSRKNVKIRIVDFDNRRISYACVWLLTPDNKVLTKKQTNKNGKCLLDISKIGEHQLLITKKGYKPLRIKTDSTRLNSFRLILLPEKLKRLDCFNDKKYHIETKISVADIVLQGKEATFFKK